MAKILAVDDSEAIRMMVHTILSAAGHEVVAHEDGRKALDYARDNTVDLVITDLNMPEMGGMSLIASLRRMASYAHVPILIMTTETADYKKQKARSAGATGWIAKPVNEERLLLAVKKTVG